MMHCDPPPSDGARTRGTLRTGVSLMLAVAAIIVLAPCVVVRNTLTSELLSLFAAQAPLPPRAVDARAIDLTVETLRAMPRSGAGLPRDIVPELARRAAADARAVAATITDAEEQWAAAGSAGVIRALTTSRPTTVPTTRPRGRRDQLDPAFAAALARKEVLRPYVHRLRRAAHVFTRMGDAWKAAGRLEDAATAYAAAAVMLCTHAAESREGDLLLLAASELTRIHRRLAGVAAARGQGLRDEAYQTTADRWDEFYAAWRARADGPPAMLPNTGASAFFPAEQRAVLMSLVRCAAAAAGAIVCGGLFVLAAAVTGIGVILRRPAVPIRWSMPATAAFVAAAAMAIAPFLATCLLLFLAGQDWSWLLSARLASASTALFLLAQVTAIIFAGRWLMRTDVERGHFRRIVRDVVLLTAVFAAAALLAGVPTPALRPALVPRAIEMIAAFARSACLLAVGVVVIGVGYRPIRRIRSLIVRRGRTAASGGPPIPSPPRRGRGLMRAAAVGLLANAALLFPMLRQNERAFLSHAQRVAAALADEASVRLGCDWRSRLPPCEDSRPAE